MKDAKSRSRELIAHCPRCRDDSNVAFLHETIDGKVVVDPESTAKCMCCGLTGEVKHFFIEQDLPSFEKASREDARTVIANSNIKIAMRLEDLEETFAIFEKEGVPYEHFMFRKLVSLLPPVLPFGRCRPAF